MSTTNPHHGGAQPQHDAHEQSDFNWTLVLWSVPAGALILVVFTLVCLYFFRGYKDEEMSLQQSKFPTTELNSLRVLENEALTQYKVIDPAAGQIQIPISRAMVLEAEAHRNDSGREWKPITDIYLEGAAFAVASPTVSASVSKPSSDGISIEEAPVPAVKVKAKKSH